MPARRKEESKVFSLADRKLVEQRSEFTPPQTKKKRRSPSQRQRSGWQSVALVCLTLLLLTTSALALYAFHLVATLRQDTDGVMGRVGARMQRLGPPLPSPSQPHESL